MAEQSRSRVAPALPDIPQELRGPRVLLRPLRLEDAPAVWEAIEESRARLAAWMPWVHALRSLEDEHAAIAAMSVARAAHRDLTMGVFDKRTGRYVGGGGFPRFDAGARVFEIGYWVRTAEEGKGYVTEAVQVLTRLAFGRLGAARVEIYADPLNARSCRVPERLGFVLEGTLRRFRPDAGGRPSDRRVYALIPEDYARLPWRDDPAG